MKKVERMIVKQKLTDYLFKVLREEECYNTFEKCREEVVRVKGKLGVAEAEDWLRGLPIGVEYSTWAICVKIFKILGWKFDPLFAFGRVSLWADDGQKTVEDTTAIDNFYWYTLGQIIVETDTKAYTWIKYNDYLREWIGEHFRVEYYGQSPVCFDEWYDNEFEFEED